MRNWLIWTCGVLWVMAVSAMAEPVGFYSSLAEPESVAVAPEVEVTGYRLAIPLQAGESARDLRFGVTFEADSVLAGATRRIPTGECRESDRGLDSLMARPAEQAVEPLGVVEMAGQRWLELVAYSAVLSGDGYLRRVASIDLRVGERAIAFSEIRGISELREARSSHRPLVASGLEGGGWVAVTGEELSGALGPLVAHRRALGLTAQVVGIDSILTNCPGNDDAARLRSFCQDFYESGGVYVFLVGDETVLPVRYAFPYDVDEDPGAEYMQICDLYFADVTGDWDSDGDGFFGERTDDEADLTPELRVGRLPVNTVVEVENYVANVIQYETDPGHGNSEYLERSFFFSSDQMRDYSGGGQHGRIASAFPEHVAIDTANGVELADGEDVDPTNQTAPELTGLLREGFGIVNVIAHGRSDAFAVRTSDYNNWPKSYMMSEPLGPGHGAASDLAGSGTCGFMYSLACDNGAFDKDQPPFNLPGRNIAQDLLAIEDGGMIGMVAYGRWGWVATSHYLQKYFFDSLFAHPDRPAVEAMYGSQAAYPYCRDLILGQLYLGDPAVRVYTEQPRHLVGDVTIVEGEFRARFTDREGIPAAGMMVLLSDSTGPLDQMVTDLEGWVSLPADLGLGHTYNLAMRDEGTTAAVFDFVPGLVTEVADEPTVRPERFALHQNYPNPFNPATTVAFDLERRAHTRLVVYNLLGQQVTVLVDGELEAGAHEVVWDGRGKSGATVASGVYFYRLESGAKACSRKMMLLK